MSPPGPLIVSALLAYLVGGFDAAYYLVRFRTGRDIRELGSGNAGARNAGRVLGRGAFAMVFLADCLKGSAAVWAAGAAGTGRAGMAVAAVAVVIGHIAPLQLGFRGGKGASTATGVLLVLAPLVGISGPLTAAVLYVVTRQTMASGVAAFLLLPAFAVMYGYARLDVLAVACVAMLLVFTHRAHVRELTTFLRRPRPATGEASR